MRKLFSRFFICVFLVALSQLVMAADLAGNVTAIWLAPNSNKLMFKIDSPASTTVCPPGNSWYGFNIALPTSHPNFPYYYGLLTTSMSKNIAVYLGGISIGSSGFCEVTENNYGIVLTK